MKKQLPLTALLLCAGLLMLNACKKGDTGPAGPAGTANVMYSPWMNATSWVASTTSTGTGKQTSYLDIDAPQVTQAILDSGSVMVYMTFALDPDGAGIVRPLPTIIYILGAAIYQLRLQFALSPGKIRVIADVLPNGGPGLGNRVRYLVIPGAVPTGRRAGPDFKDYAAVCRFYNIPE